ncbi:MAG TPA: hypothetical protein VHG51_14855 [Longimicrobiaceae bacterium]|nr:hypothetical protein [Longimicrobiaceae bacterium]
MPLTITNESDASVLVRFNSGTTHRLAPGETLKEVEHAQVKGNARIRSLADRRLIRMAEAGEAEPAEEEEQDEGTGGAEAEAGEAPSAAAEGGGGRSGSPRKSSRRTR